MQRPLEQGVLPDLLGYRLRRAQQAVFRDFAASVPEFSPGRAGMLMLIDANPGVTQSRLAQAVGLDRSTMVGVLDQLEKRGWIERRKGEDRRTNGLSLTSTGREALRRTRRSIAAHEKRVASRLTPAERAALLDLLGKLCAD
ncbi:MAG TPA: MarR family transcriptional regulator [Burkholderiales bacterium]